MATSQGGQGAWLKVEPPSELDRKVSGKDGSEGEAVEGAARAQQENELER